MIFCLLYLKHSCSGAVFQILATNLYTLLNLLTKFISMLCMVLWRWHAAFALSYLPKIITHMRALLVFRTDLLIQQTIWEPFMRCTVYALHSCFCQVTGKQCNVETHWLNHSHCRSLILPTLCSPMRGVTSSKWWRRQATRPHSCSNSKPNRW